MKYAILHMVSHVKIKTVALDVQILDVFAKKGLNGSIKQIDAVFYLILNTS